MRDEIYDQEIPDSIARSLGTRHDNDILDLDAEPTLTFTPRPQKPITLDFPDAMREIIAGKKIRKLEWADAAPECFAVLADGRLKIFIKGDLKDWIISDGDLSGEDYITVP